ncbi:MAG: tyrosine-type recombinase/integrase [Epibacterium sp.]|nr:tyrosine-type recombinase/integrase [Epibacterium sp.]
MEVTDPSDGKRLSRTFEDRGVADSWGESMRAKAVIGMETLAESGTVRAAVKEYLEHITAEAEAIGTPSLRQLGDTRRMLEKVLAELPKNVRLDDIRLPSLVTAAVGRLRQHRGKRDEEDPTLFAKLAPRTRKHYLATWRSLSKWLFETGRTHRHLLITLRSPRIPEAPPRCYTIDQLRLLVSDRCREIDESLWLFLCLVVYTGARASEVQHLQWQHVHLEAGLLEYVVTKNNESRAVPIQPELAEILEYWQEKHPAIASARVWTQPKGYSRTTVRGITAAFSQYWLPPLFAKLGIDRTGRVVHDLRHTYAALLVATGENGFEAQHNLGHKTTEMTGHYSRAAVFLRKASTGWPRGRFVLRDDLAKVQLSERGRHA